MFFSELAAILITAFLTVGVWKLFHPDATLHSFVSSGKLTTTTMKPSPIEGKYPCEKLFGAKLGPTWANLVSQNSKKLTGQLFQFLRI